MKEAHGSTQTGHLIMSQILFSETGVHFFFFQGVMVAHATLFIVHQKVAEGGDINSPHDRPLGLYGTKQTINSFLLLQT